MHDSNLVISTCIVASADIKTLIIYDFLFLVMGDPTIDGCHMHCNLKTGLLWWTWAAKNKFLTNRVNYALFVIGPLNDYDHTINFR